MDNMVEIVKRIREEPNTEKRTRMFQRLNESLPDSIKLEMPSLITNAFVRRGLDQIEENLQAFQAQA